MSSSVNLGDIPSELVKMIVENTAFKSRCVFRKTCGNYRKLVDDTKLDIKKIRLALGDKQKIQLAIDGTQIIIYKPKDDGCEIVRQEGNNRALPDSEVFLRGQNTLETAIGDLMSILRNKRLFVKKLTIRNDVGSNSELVEPFIEAFHENLSKLTHQLHIEKCRLWKVSEDDMMKILPFCQPATLKILKISLKAEGQGRLSQIINLEQWKQAEELDSTVIEPLNELLHFKKVTARRISYQMIFQRFEWQDLKNFFESIIAQYEDSPLEFDGHLLEEPPQLLELLCNYQKTPAQRQGESRWILKTLRDGSKLIFIKRNGYMGIHKYVVG